MSGGGVEAMNTEIITGLSASDPTIRLRAALAAGTTPDRAFLAALLERTAIEADFYVRDMLTWALTRLPVDLTVPHLHHQLRDPRAQARSQSLHTLSKIRHPDTWEALTPQLLHDPDDEVARVAWRLAVARVPEDHRSWLAGHLIGELGRGTPEVQRSLSRALLALEDVSPPLLNVAMAHPDSDIAAHSRATLLLIDEPRTDFLSNLNNARKVAALGDFQGQ